MFQIKHRFTDAMLFECELPAELANSDASFQLGFAVKKAVKASANLTDANLTGANLIDGGQRSDGYRFVGWVKDGALMILAGCRYFTLPEARAHWVKTRGGTPLGDETMAILDHIEAVAVIRGTTGEKA